MPTFTLKGRWNAPPHALDRQFDGEVVDGANSGLKPGDRVVVTYVNGQPAVFNPVQHGRYSLEGMPAEHFVLTSFVRKDGVINADATSDAEEQLWGGDLYVSRSP